MRASPATDRFTEHLLAAHLPHAVVIDCSGSAEVAERYEGWLAAGIHVVTPNKQAGAGPLPRYQRIRAAAAASGARFRYEATVGAGLPVITTLRDLVDTGDEVLAIEGIFSGTLAWLFNRFDGSQPFSQLVAQARSMGYTEPDPRDDLSGVDVARKLVILAREAGHALSLNRYRWKAWCRRCCATAAWMTSWRGWASPMPACCSGCRTRGRVARCCATWHSWALTVPRWACRNCPPTTPSPTFG